MEHPRLYIPISLLASASGISENVVQSDVLFGELIADHEMVSYENALQYVLKKWKQGKHKMYPPAVPDSPDCSFEARILKELNTCIENGSLTILWEHQKKDS